MQTDEQPDSGAVDLPPRLGARAHLYALLGYFALALIVTWPLAAHFLESVPGDLIADRDQNLWNLWWAKEALLRPTNPFWTDMLYYPYGAPLYYHTLGLPLGVIGLLPQLILGLPAAYNTVVLAAFVLSGYGAFRLALLFTDRPLAAFVGGVVYAFTPYTLDALKGQTEVLSVQWLPLYAEGWIRAQRTGQVRFSVWAGAWLAVTALSSLYYAMYALLFTVGHLTYLGSSRLPVIGRRSGRNNRLPITGNRLPKVVSLAITAGVAIVLTLPLIWGLIAHRDDPRLDVAPDLSQKLAYSADLFSFFVLPHDHPLVGTPERPGASSPPLHSYLSLGYFALGLSVLGLIVGRKRGMWFWAVLGLVALVLALGPELQVAGNRTGVPMPYRLLEWLPGWDGIAKVERLVVLARMCMGVMAAVGAGWLLGWLGARVVVGARHASPLQQQRSSVKAWRAMPLRSALPFATVLALLLVELPIHSRYIEPLNVADGFRVLARQGDEGGLMELPFATRQAETLGRRMLYQTVHSKPIMGGYLARSYGSPIADTCSPFWPFISAESGPSDPDIITPTLVSRPLDVLRFYGIGYLAVYETYGGPNDEPLNPEEREAFMSIVSQVSQSPPLSQEPYVTIYKVDGEGAPRQDPALLMGNNWYEAQDAGGRPFRWMREETARLCVFSPRPVRASLTMDGTAFGQERDISIGIGGREVYAGTLPSNGAFDNIRIPAVDWWPGMTEITFRSPQAPTTPKSVEPTSPDTRPLRAGFREIRLESEPPK